MAKTIDHLTMTVGVTAYEHEGCQYDALLIIVAYKKGRGFCVSWQPVKLTGYGYQTGPMPSSDPLVGGGAVVAMEATKNSVKTLEQMRTNLEAAQEGIRAYFDARELDIVNIFLKSVAKCGYTYDFEKQVKAFIDKQNNTTMATKKNNESANVQNNAQVNDNAAAIEDVNVGEVTVDSIMPVMQPVEGTEYGVESDGKTATFESMAPNIEPEKPAMTVPLCSHGTLVVGGVPKPKKNEDKPKVTLKRKVQDSVPQAAALPMVRLVVYTTKRGEQAPRIDGFGGENDPRWKRHYDDKVRLAKEKKEADAFNEKLAEKMKGKPKAEREKLRKQWKSVGSDPFGASYFTDRTTGDKFYQMTMGAKYMEVARELVDAYNSGDEQAIAASEKAVIDCKNGIVKDIEAQRDAKRAEREAKKAAAPAAKAQGTVAAGYSDQDVADMLRKVMAGGDVPENIKKLLQAA